MRGTRPDIHSPADSTFYVLVGAAAGNVTAGSAYRETECRERTMFIHGTDAF